MSLTKVSYSMINGASVNVNDFGAVGDGTTDDTTKIQAALVYGFANRKNVVFGTGQTYLITATLIIPQYQDNLYSGIAVDGKFCSIKRSGNFAIFTSGYDNAGTLTTNYGTTLDSHLSQGIRLQNFNFTSAAPQTIAALKIQDWHQGCQLLNMTFANCRTAMQANNTYYATFDSLQAPGGDGSAPLFQWLGNINLNRISNCVAVNAGGTSYSFTGGVTALTFTGNSIEGCLNGVVFNNAVYDVTIENNYIESFTGTAIKFNDYVYSAIIRNNYVNFQSAGTNYFVDYLPLPANNIVIENSNYYNEITTQAQVIKTLNSTVGNNGLTIQQYAISGGTLADLLINNALISSVISWQQTARLAGLRANVVNLFAVGNYSGQMTSGYGHANGFVNASASTSMFLTTNLKATDTQIIYVNIRIAVTSVGNVDVKGQFIGNDFYEYNGTALVKTTSVNITVPGSTVQINKDFSPNSVTSVVGEVRLI